MTTCLNCGESMAIPSGRGRKPKYCSAECIAIVAKEKKREARRAVREEGACDECGSTFLKPRATSRFCSASCMDVGKRPKRVCQTCEQPFRGTKGVQFYCSTECTPKAVNHGGSYLRRCRVWNVPFEKGIDRNTVAERVGTQCYVCHEEIDMNVEHPNPLSPTVEHIVPLSRGGGHVWGNVALSHFVCNNRKGPRD